MCKNRKTGFTLVEMLAVITILGIAAMVIIPSIGDSSDLKLSSAGRQLVADLLFAQTYSIAQRKPYQVVFDTVNNSYEIQDSSDGSVLVHPVTKLPYRMNFPADAHLSQVTITSAAFDGGSLVKFDTMGMPYNSTGNQLISQGQVTLAAGTQNTSVMVEPISGRINMP